MSALMSFFLLWIMLIHKQECAVIHLDHSNKRMKNNLEYILQKYLNPLRKLTADLPNHAIEMQIEILDTIPRDVKSQKPQRRVIRVINSHRPKSDTAGGLKAGKLVRKKPIQRSGDPVTNEGTTVTITAAAATEAGTTTVSSDPVNVPVYMDDLKKALEELEKKLISNTTTTIAGGDGVPCAPNGDHPKQVRTIDDIVQLLKKAVHVESRLPNPTDENIEWVQLKIPKNV